MNYSERIYELRKNADISQEALAKAIGSTRQQVSRWECGSSVPSMKYVEGLAAYFHTDVNDIMCADIHAEDVVKEEAETDRLKYRLSMICVIDSVLFMLYVALWPIIRIILFAASRAHETNNDQNWLDVTYYQYYSKKMLLITFGIITFLLISYGILQFVLYFREVKNRIYRYNAYKAFMIFLAVSLSFASAYFYMILRFSNGTIWGEVIDEILCAGGFFLIYRAVDVFISLLLVAFRKNSFMVSECGKGLFITRIIYVVITAVILSIYIVVLYENRDSYYEGLADGILNLFYFPLSLILNVVFEILFHSLKKKEE